MVDVRTFVVCTPVRPVRRRSSLRGKRLDVHMSGRAKRGWRMLLRCRREFEALAPAAGAPLQTPEELLDERPHGRVGVIDIGSNTVRLVVYDVPTRLPIPIFNEKAQCALGAGLGRSGRLSSQGGRRGVAQPRPFSSDCPTPWASTGCNWWRRRRCATPSMASPSSPGWRRPAAGRYTFCRGREELASPRWGCSTERPARTVC